MDVTPATARDLPLIKAYGDGGFKVGESQHTGSILISHNGVLSWSVRDIKNLRTEDFASLMQLETKPEILIVGTGKMQALLPVGIRNELRAVSIIPEAMDTGAACRTYNVLATEGRRVAALLIAIE